MAITVVTPGNNQANDSAATNAFNYDVGAGSNRYLIVAVGFQIANGVTSVPGITYIKGASPTAMTQIAQLDDGDAVTRALMFAMIAPDTGSNEVEITWNTTGTHEYAATAIAFTDVNQTTPIGTARTNTETEVSTNPPSVNVLNVNSGELVIDCFSGRRTATLAVGSGQTERSNLVQGFTHFGMSTEAGTGTVTMNWTSTADIANASIGVALKPTAAAAGNPLAGSLGGMGVGW